MRAENKEENNKNTTFLLTRLRSTLRFMAYVIEIFIATSIDMILVACAVHISLNPILLLAGAWLIVSLAWHYTAFSAHSRLWAYFTSLYLTKNKQQTVENPAKVTAGAKVFQQELHVAHADTPKTVAANLTHADLSSSIAQTDTNIAPIETEVVIQNNNERTPETLPINQLTTLTFKRELNIIEASLEVIKKYCHSNIKPSLMKQFEGENEKIETRLNHWLHKNRHHENMMTMLVSRKLGLSLEYSIPQGYQILSSQLRACFHHYGIEHLKLEEINKTTTSISDSAPTHKSFKREFAHCLLKLVAKAESKAAANSQTESPERHYGNQK